MTDRLIVRRVEGNLKGEHILDLGAKTLIHGPNEAGKSSITDMISLALTGKVPDLAGRTEVATAGDLMALAPGREGELHAAVWLGTEDSTPDTWSKVSISITGAEGRAKSPVRSIPPEVADIVNDAVMPIRDLRKLFQSSSTEAKRSFFFKAAVDSVTEREVKALFAGAERDSFVEVMKSLGAKDWTSDLVVRVRAAANEEKNRAKRELDQATADLTAVAGMAEAPPLDSDVEALRATVTRLEGLARAKGQADLAAQQRQQTEVQLQQAHARLGAISSEAQAISTELSQTSITREGYAQAAEAAKRFEALKVVARHQADAAQRGEAHECILCGQGLGHDPYAVAARAEQVSGFVDQMLATRWEPLRAQMATIEAKMQRFEALRAEYDQVNNWIIHTQQGLDMYTEGPAIPDDVHGQLRLAVASLTDAEGKQRAYTKVRQARDAKARCAEEKDRYQRLVDACDEAMASLLAKGVEKFEARVNRYLPKHDRFRLVLREGDGAKAKDVCYVGLEKADGLHTALSKATWAKVTMAVACALAESRPLAVIVPEEAAFDPDNLRHTMAGLSKAPAQVILTHPIKNSGRAPSGWTLVDAAEVFTTQSEAGDDAGEEE